MIKSSSIYFLIFLLFILIPACKDNSISTQYQFELLDKNVTGIDSKNELSPSLDLNVFNYMYFYNGGGVSVADFNNDGLIDIFFTRNMQADQIYLNEGNFQFKNISSSCGIDTEGGWSAGASAIDINNDGLMDIYISRLGEYRNIEGRNQLFICTHIDEKGIPHYENRASKYKLDLKGFGTQASFFDYDLDGDLDMFQLNHSLHENGTFGQRHRFDSNHDLSGDKLMRNDNGIFTDVTMSSGILSTVIGYGLGIATSDFNHDGWPDIYICNDFHENDYLYINQKDGTFKDELIEKIRHTSRFSMGVDIADINNDGESEIFSLDMHPYDPFIMKSSLGEDSYAIFNFKVGYGYNHQYARNNLQLNNGNGTFSEIGLYADVYASDWSWAPLFFDFDNDGNKDLFISNGIPKRMNDIDYVNFVSNDEVQWKIKMDELEETDLALSEKLPEIKLYNQFFKNNGNLTFGRINDHIKNNRISFSNGSAYADFDNDGDLDAVVNNIDDEPFIYKNLYKNTEDKKRNFIHLKLKGSEQNIQAIGAKLIVKYADQIFVTENYPVRGYQSNVENGLFLGLGAVTDPDSIILIWPDQSFSLLSNEIVNNIKQISWEPGLPEINQNTPQSTPHTKLELADISESTGLDFVHDENPFVEFNREQLIPHMVSREGPALAIGDINGDGLEDVFFGGAKRRRNKLYLQSSNGQFKTSIQKELVRDSIYEDVDACFADIDNDGDLDLIIASGGNEYKESSVYMSSRIYKNNGKGQFRRIPSCLDDIKLVASCVEAADYDNDGDIDLFLGARSIPWNYGKLPSSYILQNDGKGVFTDVSSDVAKDLSELGLIKDAIWYDFDADYDLDLALAIEWGPMTLLVNESEGFIKKEISLSNGWWNCIIPADFDNDGDIDFIAGNLGKNSKLKASVEKPVKMYIGDFDKNGQVEQLFTFFFNNEEIVFHTYKEITSQMPDFKKEFLFAKEFAKAEISDFIKETKLTDKDILQVYVFENSYFENQGSLNFKRKDLPQRLQFSPITTGLVMDKNKDGMLDIILAGNYYENNIELGRYDADYGNLLINSENGFLEENLHPLFLEGQVRKVLPIRMNNSEAYIFAKNDEASSILTINLKQ
jgi:hypothetical protein